MSTPLCPPHSWGYWHTSKDPINLTADDYLYQRECQIMGCGVIQEARDLKPVRGCRQVDTKKCDHDWVDARNQFITSGLWCRKCNAVKADDR